MCFTKSFYTKIKFLYKLLVINLPSWWWIPVGAACTQIKMLFLYRKHVFQYDVLSKRTSKDLRVIYTLFRLGQSGTRQLWASGPIWYWLAWHVFVVGFVAWIQVTYAVVLAVFILKFWRLDDHWRTKFWWIRRFINLRYNCAFFRLITRVYGYWLAYDCIFKIKN